MTTIENNWKISLSTDQEIAFIESSSPPFTPPELCQRLTHIFCRLAINHTTRNSVH